MIKKIIIAFIVLIALILGSYYLLKKMSSNTNQTTNFYEEQTNLSASPSAQSETKLKIEDLKIGQGKEVKSGDVITVHYLGKLANGQKFDSSYDRNQPFETQIGVGQVIQGWDEGLLGMKVGGKRKLTIPPELGYGEQGAGTAIPSNSTLIFEIELISIK